MKDVDKREQLHATDRGLSELSWIDIPGLVSHAEGDFALFVQDVYHSFDLEHKRRYHLHLLHAVLVEDDR